MTIAEKLRDEGRQQGFEQGREETQRENLITLLSLRFGVLSDSLVTRIQRADDAQLEHWFRRGATAQRLDDVFTDEP